MKLKFLVSIFGAVMLAMSCNTKPEVKNNRYTVKEVKKEKFRQVNLIDNITNEKLTFYFDRFDNLIQMKNHKKVHFEINFNKDKGVVSLENVKSNSESECFWIEDSNSNNALVIEKFRFPFKSRIFIYDKFCPQVENYTTVNINGNWFLQEYRYFDFRLMKVIPREYSEYIQLLDRPEKEIVGKKGTYQFKIISRYKDNQYLVTGKFKHDFTPVGNLDTTRISSVFSYNFTPSSFKDTIRFVIHHEKIENKNEKSIKTIYYQLPVYSTKK